MTREQMMLELEKLAQPLVDFLRSYFDPHYTIVIDMFEMKLTRDEYGAPMAKGQSED